MRSLVGGVGMEGGMDKGARMDDHPLSGDAWAEGSGGACTRSGQPATRAKDRPADCKPLLQRIPVLRHLLVVLGFLFAGVGAVGIVIPVLPTTPLLLLATACFANGSERFHTWFCGTKLYKKYLEDFVRTRSMPMRVKLCICVPVSCLLVALIVAIPVLPMRILIGVLMAVKWWFFLFWIKTEPTAVRGVR